ncbi:hypothetical protein EDB80DRAFT_692566 [Ilyonectria destructans]|nr:hypothetical protein EDB80DRAFT_692566 [Ilyonectria destructans]
MARILALAHEVVGPDDEEDASCTPSVTPAVEPTPTSTSTSTTKLLAGIPENDTPGDSSTSPPGDSSTSSHSSEDTMDCDTQTGTDPAYRAFQSALILALPGPPGTDYHIPDQPPEHAMVAAPPLPPQIYGNGWTITNTLNISRPLRSGRSSFPFFPNTGYPARGSASPFQVGPDTPYFSRDSLEPWCSNMPPIQQF